MGNNDADSCVPTLVTDFIFDLADSVTLSQLPEEQSKLYTTTFRELCSKYFASSPWPSPQAIASECNGHPLFLAIYREVTHRHWHSVSRPTVRDRLEGWSVYKEVLDELLDDDSTNSQQRQSPFYLLPDWCFDMLHEFVYQFQGFCQFRAAVHAAAKKHNVPIDGSSVPANAPHHLMENISQLNLHKDAWAVETVMYYLHRLMAVGKTSQFPGYQYLGIFASIALSRLECLLGDHAGCLIAADSMMEITVGDDTASEIIQSVVGARLSHAYHISVAYMMTRRYQMAISTLGATCTYLQRGFKTGQLATRKSQQQGDPTNTAQYSKLFDRMIALLAILTHICPPRNQLDESLLRSIRDKHGSQLAKMDDTTPTPTGGTPPRNVYQDLFCFASPKFIAPTLGGTDVYKLQVRQFQSQMAAQQESRKLRSYMKLYTSIELSKLAAFYDDSNPQAFTSLLLSYKHTMLQEEEDGEKKSALDIHYHLQGDMVNVDEAEKQRRFENYFMAQIRQNEEIARSVEQISTVV